MPESQSPVILETHAPIATIVLNKPHRRNALGLDVLDALDDALDQIKTNPDIHVVLIRGEGKVFCAGFDLDAAAEDHQLVGKLMERLSNVLRAIRRLPCIVVAAVQGAAVAGGCAILSACDFVVVSAVAKCGYPVHRLGISPAVSLPTLRMAIGDGNARALMMSGELIDGRMAHSIGLASHVVDRENDVLTTAENLCHNLSQKPPNALRVTKAWLNELDGSLDDAAFDGPMYGTAKNATGQEAQEMLANWKKTAR